jgi:CheY-like chemotaxis protein
MRLPDVPAANRFRILIVEDDPIILRLVSIHIKMTNFETFTASDGLQGWHTFQSVDPHLVLTDINMPGLSGHELVEKIREVSAVPILMMTAADTDESQMKGFKVGADDYIAKPFNPKLLTARVVANLRRVYRYDSETTAAPVAPKAPVKPPEPPQPTMPPGWTKCDACEYLGPLKKFETQNAMGEKVAQCPNCFNRNLTFSVG